jgi:plasmid stabilization system protein ParE
VRIEFFPAAEQELTEAAGYYEAERQGLGTDFLLEVERICAVLVELPALGEKLDLIHRRLPLRRFPHALIFRCDGDAIRVVALAHRRRKPRYWSPRVQEP